ncbi:unnamed protein product [Microthlaspi erraticum]|uniref:Uncharacterized protein n=1 Tax=Microthlaspi erraticum TaxID=1685480 RepID=A0A6D2JS86_9BRAS|nr:unnamed protein product [Microthlaspi erraticum]
MPLEDDVFDLQTHLLHGMIHTNGYGHLICVNGMEGGSKHLCGREIVDLWDRICTNLGARMITVEDISKKSYGVTKSDYENAIELLGSLELDQVESAFNEHKQFKEVKQIFRYYRDMSEEKINRLFLKKSDAVENEKSSQRFRIYSDVAANLGSRWPVRRLEYASEVIVESLKEMKALNQNGMTRQHVRDAARLHIGDTGLLDYVLKLMNNVVVGNVLVRRYVDPLTRILHYTIQELGDDHHDATKLIGRREKKLQQINELPPGELVTVLLQATVFDLKQAIEDTFRDTYCILTNFTVNEIDELEEDDRNLLFGRVENCSALTVRGFGIEEIEAQVSRWVSYHTRSCGIDDSDTLPPLYVCSNCCEEFAEQQRRVLQPKYEFPSQDHNMLLLEGADDYFGDERCLGVMFPSESFLSEQYIL